MSEILEATVFVVDDDDQVRKSINQLAQSIGLTVATFANAFDFLAAIKSGQRGCVVTDVRMPGMSGLELQASLNASDIDLPVIVMTGYAEVHMAVQAFHDGAFDFVEKPFSPQKLLEVIQRAIRFDGDNSERQGRIAATKEKIELLSRRESEVMEMLVAGKTTKEIAKALGVGLTTIDFHRNNTLNKMEVESVVELARVVAEYELLK